MTWLRTILLVASTGALSGCVIGNWSICGPQTPLYHCDAEAEKRLLHPTPLSDKWEKSGISQESRRRDWIGCGGNASGLYDNPVVDGVASEDAGGELYFSVQRCMLKKGYNYNGPCNNEVTMAFPGCGAP